MGMDVTGVPMRGAGGDPVTNLVYTISVSVQNGRIRMCSVRCQRFIRCLLRYGRMMDPTWDGRLRG